MGRMQMLFPQLENRMVVDSEWPDAERFNRLGKLPKCSECGDAIQEERCYEINGEIICENCMDGHRIYAENLID